MPYDRQAAHSVNLFQDAGQATKGQHGLLLTGFCTCKVQEQPLQSATAAEDSGITFLLLAPASWLPSHVYLPHHSWWCRHGQPGTLSQSTSLAFLLSGPDDSNRRCRSSWTTQSLPRTPSCRPVTCQVQTGSESPGEAKPAFLTDG